MTIKVKNLTLGEGRPKICAPVTAADIDALRQEARSFRGKPIDLVEWRMGCFRNVKETEKALNALNVIKEELPELPLLSTFRTSREGGNTEFSAEEYLKLNKAVLKSGFTDLIDAELYMGSDLVRELLQAAHKNDVRVIISNHDFHSTPSEEEIISRLKIMQDTGADIAKIAVMPTCRKDVLTLLNATREMYENYAKIPLITMSMSATGLSSRILGEEYGSAVTFGSAGRASAPGQINVEELSQVLNILHRAKTAEGKSESE